MTAGGGKRVFVLDGYNVIQRSTLLRPLMDRSLEAARAGLVHQCRDRMGLQRDTAEYVIVFDGRSDVGNYAERPHPGLRLIFTETCEEADDRIPYVVASYLGRNPVTVVTDDSAVRRCSVAEGATFMSVSEFVGGIVRKKMKARSSVQYSRKSTLSPRQEQAINQSLIREWGLEEDT